MTKIRILEWTTPLLWVLLIHGGCAVDSGNRRGNGEGDAGGDAAVKCSTTTCTKECNDKGFSGAHFCNTEGTCVCTGEGEDSGLNGDSGNSTGSCDIDILIVFDTSGSMMDAAENLASVAFPCFADELVKYPHLGKIRVALTDHLYGTGTVGTETVQHSAFLTKGWPVGQPHDAFNCEEIPTVDCHFSSGQSWMEGPSDTLYDEFACVGRVACEENATVTEPTLQAGLESLRFPDNASFLREKALLVTVFITDEDDQSSLNITSIHDEILKLKGGDEKFVVALTMGGPQKGTVEVNSVTHKMGCISSNYGGTEETPKLIEFSKLFGTRGLHYNMCDTDLCGAFTNAIDALKMSCNQIIVQ